MKSEEPTFKIRGAIFEVYREVGPGLLESYYEHALTLELEDIGCKVQRQVPIIPTYKGQPMELGYRLDMLVDDEVVIEVKSVEHFHDVHKKQHTSTGINPT